MAGLTAYITPEMLKNSPTGVAWDTIPNISRSRDINAALVDICNRATSYADSFCNQDLRATINTDELSGPDSFRFTVNPNTGYTRVVLSRWPVLSVSQVSVAVSSQWTFEPLVGPPTPPWRIEGAILNEYGSVAPGSSGAGPSALILATGSVTWVYGRDGFVVQVVYTNGWPHSGSTAPMTAGDTSIQVDDCTGMVGCIVTVYDTGYTENLQIASTSVTAGPGTATLSAGTAVANNHDTGVLVTTLPPVVHSAMIKLCSAEAYQRGAMSITAGQQPGQVGSTTGKMDQLKTDAEIILSRFARTI